MRAFHELQNLKPVLYEKDREISKLTKLLHMACLGFERLAFGRDFMSKELEDWYDEYKATEAAKVNLQYQIAELEKKTTELKTALKKLCTTQLQ